MIAPSRNSRSIRSISRRYEFTRLQDQTLASVYEALIPVISRRPERRPHQGKDCEVFTGVHRFPQRSVAGA